MDAEPTLRPAPPPSPTDEYLAQARLHLSQGNALQAKAVLKNAIAADPGNDEAVRLLLAVDAQASSLTGRERGTSLADLRLKAFGLWVLAAIFLCMSVSYSVKAAKAGPHGSITMATKSGKTRQVPSQVGWSYAVALLLPALISGGFGFYLLRDE